MNRHQTRLVALILAPLLALGTLVSSPAQAATDSTANPSPSYRLEADRMVVSPQESVRVTLWADQADDLYGYEAVLHYDDKLLELKTSEGKFEGYTVEPKGTPGTKVFVHSRTGHVPGFSGAVPLADFMFKTKAAGAAAIELEKVTAIASNEARHDWGRGTVRLTVQISKQGGNPGTPGPVEVDEPTVEQPQPKPALNGGLLLMPKDAVMTTTDDGRVIWKAVVQSDTFRQGLHMLKQDHNLKPRLVVAADVTADEAVLEIPLNLMAEAYRWSDRVAISLQHAGAFLDVPLTALQSSGKSGNDYLENPLAGDVLRIRISRYAAEGMRKLEQAAAQSGVSLTSDGFDFRVDVEAQDKLVELERTPGIYMTRGITLSNGRTADQAAGFLYDEASGKLSFVPAVLRTTDTQTELIMKRQGNSVYATGTARKSFADLAGHWSRKDVELLASKLLVDGRNMQEYAPDSAVTRAEFAKLLAEGLGLDMKASVLPAQFPFRDVAASDWFSPYIAAAYESKLIDGVTDDAFAPEALITREQMAVMAVRALEIAGRPLPQAASSTDRFADGGEISPWAARVVGSAADAGLMSGREEGRFAPSATTTRGEAATVVKRLLLQAGLIGE